MAQLVPVDGDPFAMAGAAKLVPVDGDPFSGGDGAAPKLVQVDHDPFAARSSQEKAPEASLRAYEPTWREKLAQAVIPDERGYVQDKMRELSSVVLGTTGLPGSEQIGAVDFTPARIPLFAQEAARSAADGNYGTAALEAIGAVPIPLIDKAIKGAVRAGTKAIDAVRPTVADDALRQIDEAAAQVGKQAGKPVNGQVALRDWLLTADDEAKAAQEAATASEIPKAPIPVETQIAAPGLKSGPDGAFRIVTPDNGMEIGARPQIVELSELKFAGGNLQPRDRGRVEYTSEMLERASRLDPEQLRPGRVSDSGAPIVSPDGTILSGNGRARSIAHVYSDPALSERAQAYRASLGPEAANMRQPVMVMRSDAMTPDEAAKFADLSNRGRIAAMSATERAARDAKALGSDGVSLYQGGDFEAPQNQAFLRHFMDKVVTAGERPSVSNAGRLTQEGSLRMRNAVMASAYDDAGLLSKMLESSDDNIRNLTGALSDAAPRFASLKADIAAGQVLPEMDATPQIVDAVKKIADLRNNGVTADRWFSQLDAFDDTDPIVKEWVRAFHTDDLARPASRQQMTEVLNAYATEAAKHAPGGLFEDTTKAADVLSVARKGSDESARTSEALAGDQAAGYGARDAARGGEALEQQVDAVGSSSIRGGGQAGDGSAGAARDAGKGQARDLSSVLPRPKSPQEILLDTNKARLGAALGMKGDVLPSRAFSRIEELARSGSADDVASLLKAKNLIGAEAWPEVSSGVLTRLGLGSDLGGFASAWREMPQNGRNVLASGETRQVIDDLVNVLETVAPLKSLTDTKLRRVADNLGSVPIVGEALAKAISTKTGDALAHAALGYSSAGASTAAAVGAKVAGKFVMRPRNARAMTRWLSAYRGIEENSKAAGTVFVLASRNLAKLLADESGGDEREISRALESVREAD